MNLRPILFFTLAFAQFVTSRFHEFSGMGRSVGDMATDAPTPATPAGYAFLIWILIFTLWAVCAAHQARPSNRNSGLWQRLGWPMVVTMAAGNLWMLTATLHGNGLILLTLILIMAAGAFVSLGRAVAAIGTDIPASQFNTRLALPALSIMAGWLTLATFLNLAGALQISLHIPTGSTLGAIATLTAATVVGGYVLGALRHQPVAALSYAFTLLWGLVAVALANANLGLSAIGISNPTVGVTALVCSAIVLLILACQKPRKI